MFPAFVIVIGTVFGSPKYAAMLAGAPNTAAYVTGMTAAASRSGTLPSVPNHATPSRTRSNVSTQPHGVGGATTVAVTFTELPVSTLDGSCERRPSQTTTLPVPSVQW